ncbi:hypothetical protein NBRC116493_25120 [Aurantivibrio infirmus]
MKRNQWELKGCGVCRALWESGQRPSELAVNLELHSRLHKCSACGAYWEQLERYADVIEEEQAKRMYPNAFDNAGLQDE